MDIFTATISIITGKVWPLSIPHLEMGHDAQSAGYSVGRMVWALVTPRSGNRLQDTCAFRVRLDLSRKLFYAPASFSSAANRRTAC